MPSRPSERTDRAVCMPRERLHEGLQGVLGISGIRVPRREDSDDGRGTERVCRSDGEGRPDPNAWSSCNVPAILDLRAK